jgi:hypothetical protein
MRRWRSILCVKRFDMKKFAGIIIMVMLAVGCAGGGKPVINSNGMELDVAIREATAQMEAKIPSNTMVALVSVASPSTAFSTQVLTRLESAIVSSGKLVVVDRANLDKVREEQGFQLSGEVDDESAKSIGKLLGAGAIVTGSLADLGDVYSLTLKAINIETATVVVSYLADLAKSARIETLLASSGGAGTGTATTPGRQVTTGSVATQTKPATPPAPIYKIGDTGPAGGLIFYDKGNNSGGWRYLEAAPEETEQSALYYGIGYKDNLRESRRLGDGKENTDRFIAEFQREGGGINTAPWICSELVINGFDDWYLPSLDELLYMYNNLYLKGLGGLQNRVYWSSSIVIHNTLLSSLRVNYAVVDFIDGSEKTLNGMNISTTKNQVRAVRRF